MKKILFASDHAGFELKSHLLKVNIANFSIHDCGCFDDKSCDFPDFAYHVVNKIKDNENSYGVLICKTGIGMSMMANRFSWINAALCFSEESARLTREHNNANVLCLGSLYHKNFHEYDKILNTFFNTDFLAGKYQKRIDLIDKYVAKK